VCVSYEWSLVVHSIQGRIQDFQLGGAHLKKMRRAEEGAKIFGVFRVKNHDFFQLRREARKLLGYFVWKITILRQKIIFFPILEGGGGAPGTPPPCIAKIPHPIYYNPMSSPPQKSHLCQTEMISRVVFVQNLEYPFCNLHLIFALCS
jgi:hypothetical protein